MVFNYHGKFCFTVDSDNDDVHVHKSGLQYSYHKYFKFEFKPRVYR